MSANDPLRLEGRQVEVLRAIIRQHVETGEPIASRTATQSTRLGLSAASIRSIMSELEDLGLLSQPHTSAGRVPTDHAYRYYVDQLLGKPRMTAGHAEAIELALSKRRGEVDGLLGQASRQLSQLSNNVGLVLAPALRRIIVDHLEFVRLDARRVVAILVGRSGVVHNRILHLIQVPDQPELDQCGRYLSDEFGGKTLPEMRESLGRKMGEERAAYDQMLARRLELGRKALERTEQESELFVEGAANLLDAPEFADQESMRTLLRALDQKSTLIELLNRVLEDEGVQVVIGSENEDSGLSECSVVASSYGAPDRVIGTVGIVGPKRMEYARAVALVDYLAQLLTRLLSRRED
jgi:heat-inducible transcriptional repressor